MAPSPRRRGHGEDSIYFDASKNRWIGAGSRGFSPDGARRIRHKVQGRTKAEVRDKPVEVSCGAHSSCRLETMETLHSVVRLHFKGRADGVAWIEDAWERRAAASNQTGREPD